MGGTHPLSVAAQQQTQHLAASPPTGSSSSSSNSSSTQQQQQQLATGVTAASISAAPNTMGPTGGPARECAGCRKRITERFLLKALDLFWHEDCLKCGCCDCRLGEVGSTLYNRANLILCKRDYLRYASRVAKHFKKKKTECNR